MRGAMSGKTVYRAVCLGRPIGPWRSSLKQVHRDLMEEGLGQYSEWSCTFYVTVPGDIEHAWRSDVLRANQSHAGSAPDHSADDAKAAAADRDVLVRRVA